MTGRWPPPVFLAPASRPPSSEEGDPAVGASVARRGVATIAGHGKDPGTGREPADLGSVLYHVQRYAADVHSVPHAAVPVSSVPVNIRFGNA